MAVELRQLRALVAVVDEGTFTDAAIALGTNQPSVSRAVAALEHELGTPLLLRSTRQITLSAAGARAVRYAREALEAVAALQRNATESPDLRVGYAWSALGEHTATVQRRWADHHPGHDLLFITCNNSTAGLAAGVADIAVLRRLPADPRFELEQVGTEPRVAALAQRDPLARRRSLRLADFAGRTVAIHSKVGTTTEELWPGDARPAAYRDAPTVDDYMTLVAAGQAVGVTSAATRQQHQRTGVVYRRLTDAPPIAVYLAWWRGDPPRGARELVNLVKAAYTGHLDP